MTTIANPELLEAHTQFVATCKEQGLPIKSYSTPCCVQQLEDRVPPESQPQWDSLVSCPFCRALFLKVARHDGITGHIPGKAA